MEKDYVDFIKQIGEAKTKEEEQEIIRSEVGRIKDDINKSDLSAKRIKESLMRLIYCEMLGIEVPFGYVFSINATQHTKLINKRTAYLAVSLFLDEDSELNLLSTHSIRKGLDSRNYLEVCAALTTLSTLVSAGTIPAFYPVVEKLLSHTKYMVRQKAVMAMHRMWQKDHSAVDIQRVLRASLCDQKPSVMAAALCAFQDVLRVTIDENKKKTPNQTLGRDMDDEVQSQFAKANTSLVPAFVQILWQVIERRLPKSFDYHNVPAPWLQVHLLDILGLLGRDNKAASDQIYDVVIGTLKAAAATPNIASSAVVYECVRTATRLYPNSHLLQLAGTVIDRFMVSKDNNMRSLGIKALSGIVRRHPGVITQQHHMGLIESLESNDETIRRETLDLLYRMTNSKNIVAIIQKMLEQLKSTSDEYLKKGLVTRILQVSERYAPSPQWYLNTLSDVFVSAGTVINTEVAHHLTRLVAEDDDSEGEGNGIKKYAALNFTKQLHSAVIDGKVSTLPDVLVQCMAWVVGEYAPLVVNGNEGIENVLLDLCDLFLHHQSKAETRSWVINAIAKLVARLGRCPSAVIAATEDSKGSSDIDVQQTSYEISTLMKYPKILAFALPEDASWEEVEVDTNLSFLNTYTSSKKCTRKYIPSRERGSQLSRRKEQPQVALNFKYPSPSQSKQISSKALLSSSKEGSLLNTGSSLGGKKSMWTVAGYTGSDNTPSPTGSQEPEQSITKESLADIFSGLSVPASPTPTKTSANVTESLSVNKSREIYQNKPKPSEAETKKSQLANALFAGLSDVPSEDVKQLSQTKRSAKQKASQSNDNIFGGLSLVDFSTSVTQNQPPKKNDVLDVLLDIGSTSSHQSAPTVQSSKSDNFLDMLSSTVPLQPQSTPSSKSTLEDMLGLSSTSQFSRMNIPGELSFDSLTCSTTIASQVFPNISPRTKLVTLFRNAQIAIGFACVPNGQSSKIAVFIANISGNLISSLEFAFAPMIALNVLKCSGDVGVQVSNLTASISSVKPQEVAAVLFDVKVTSFVLQYGIVLRGAVSGVPLPDTVVPFEIADAIRPLLYNTQQFGGQWVRMQCEKKIKVKQFQSLELAIRSITSTLNIHSVQIIGAEGIMCGVIEEAMNVPQMQCFLHYKYDMNSVLTIRTADRNFTESIAKCCAPLMQM